MKYQFFVSFALLCFSFQAMGQSNNLKSLDELINKKDPAWPVIEASIQEATNKVEVLKKDSMRANKTLLQAQVTSWSSMGAVIYETGGILIENGWIRIIGSGSEQLNRSLMDWNKGKSFKTLGEPLPFLLIADDVLGGFFAINAGAFGQDDIGKVFYFAPDNLKWESTELTYTQFLNFCFSGDLKKFYEGFQWENWEKDISTITGTKGVSCYPFLFTEEGKDINKVYRKVVPIEELWSLHNDLQKQLNGEK